MCGTSTLVPPDAAAPFSPTATTSPGGVNEPSFSSLAGMPIPPNAAHNSDAATVARPPGLPPRDDPQTVELAPVHVPGFEILREVGRGGMGVVYEAKQTSLHRTVALKMILAGAHAGPNERGRFRREAEAVASLQDPHIVQIFEVGEADGHPYLVLEFVGGGSLAQQLVGQPWHPRDAAALIKVLAHAVHYAHTQGVIHRDLKPGNVLLPSASAESRKMAKITDFGLAKRLDSPADDGGTKTGAVMGTPGYIAPEQAAGKKDVGPGADIYALGAILYECLTGRPPFRGETLLDTVLQVLKNDPVAPRQLQPTIPRDLETICLTCLARTAEKRYSSALALAEDLHRFLAREPIRARPVSVWARGMKWARRHPAMAAFGIVAAVATVAVVVVLSVAYAEVSEAVKQKEQEAEIARLARKHEATEREKAQRSEAVAQAEREKAEKSAADAQVARREAVDQAERTKRLAYALQLAQVGALSERDPRRALGLLDDPGRCPPELRDFTWAYLRRLCQREDRVYAEHRAGDALAAVAVAPGGVFVATAGKLGRARVWDPRTGRTYATLEGHTGPILGLAFSPDGAVLATAGADHTVRLWEFPANILDAARRTVNTFTFLGPYLQPAVLKPAVTLRDTNQSEATCVAFTPDGRAVAAGLGNGMVRFWALGGWRVNPPDAAVLGGPGAIAAFLAQRPDPSRAVWPIHELSAHNGRVLCLAFTESGHMMATGGDDKTARVWPVDPAHSVRVIDKHGGPVVSVAFTPDGKTLATVNNGRAPSIRLIDTETWKDTRRLIGHTAPIQALAISPDGQVLASGGADRSVRLWDLEDGRERASLLGHTGTVEGVAYGGDRRSVISVATDARARVWQTGIRSNESTDLTTDAQLGVAAIGRGGSPVVAGDENGKTVLFVLDVRPGAARGPVIVSDHRYRQIPIQPSVVGRVHATAVVLDGRFALAAGDSGIDRWPIPQFGAQSGVGGLTPSRPFRTPTPKPVIAMAADPGDKLLATLDADGLRLWDLNHVLVAHEGADGNPAPKLIPAPGGHAVLFHPTAGRLVIALGAGVRVVDVANGTVVADHQGLHTSPIEAIAFGPTGEVLATADTTGRIHVWHVRPDGGLTLQAELLGHTDAVKALAFSPDGRALASGGLDRSVRLWDPVTGQERAVLAGHADQVVLAQFTPGGRALLTMSRDGVLKRWRADPRELPKEPNSSRQAPRRSI